MSLTRDQQRDLNQISEYFKKIETITTEDSIDLDVFVTEYNEDGFSIYATEKIRFKTNSDKRKNIFEKSTTVKPIITTKIQ